MGDRLAGGYGAASIKKWSHLDAIGYPRITTPSHGFADQDARASA
jgi:hypothetical protein